MFITTVHHRRGHNVESQSHVVVFQQIHSVDIKHASKGYMSFTMFTIFFRFLFLFLSFFDRFMFLRIINKLFGGSFFCKLNFVQSNLLLWTPSKVEACPVERFSGPTMSLKFFLYICTA